MHDRLELRKRNDCFARYLRSKALDVVVLNMGVDHNQDHEIHPGTGDRFFELDSQQISHGKGTLKQTRGTFYEFA